MSPSDRRLRFAGRIYLALTLFFLYTPIFVMAAMSFNASPFYRLPVEWTTSWYVKLASNAGLIDAGIKQSAGGARYDSRFDDIGHRCRSCLLPTQVSRKTRPSNSAASLRSRFLGS